MAPLFSLLFVLTLSLLITRIASTALVLTGMSRDSARFQARSAFTGVGFTTSETESVVQHPVRRHIVMVLMLLGNAGIVTAVASLILTFTATEQVGTSTAADGQPGSQRLLWNIALLLIGIVALLVTSSSQTVDRHMSRAISWMLKNWTSLDVRDYVALLQLSKGYTVLEVSVEKGDWIANKDLLSLRLPREGVLVLGVQRPDGTYVGTPTAKTEVHVGDRLTLYGKLSRLQELSQRKGDAAGAFARAAAVSGKKQIVIEEQAKLRPVSLR